MKLAAVDNYLRTKFPDVKGWCNPYLWNVIEPLHHYQQAQGIDGPICEIGIFQGKFFIPLALTKKEKGVHLAIDVFDLQQFNLDGAGRASLDAFKTNLSDAGLDQSEIAMIRQDSMTLKQYELDRIREAHGEFSIFSVDGCHMQEHTINDFKVAMELTSPAGIITIDDYYNFDWPGVHEGISLYYLNERPRFVPLIYATNKLFCCHIGYHSEYLKILKEHFAKYYGPAWVKPVKRYGYDSLNYNPRGNIGFVAP